MARSGDYSTEGSEEAHGVQHLMAQQAPAWAEGAAVEDRCHYAGEVQPLDRALASFDRIRYVQATGARPTAPPAPPGGTPLY